MKEFELEDNEWISKVQTKTNKSNGRLIRINIETTKNRTFDSQRNKIELQRLTTPWNVDYWPHNKCTPDQKALILAYCSGLDEKGAAGVGRLLNLHWVEM